MSRLNRDWRPRVSGVTNKILNGRTLNFDETYYMVMLVQGDAGSWQRGAGGRGFPLVKLKGPTKSIISILTDNKQLYLP